MVMMRSDDRLARSAAAGDRSAFAAIYERHGPALQRYALTITRNPDDARDVVQSAMTNALVALGRGVPDAPLRPWLFRITHNEAISALRRRRPHAELQDDLLAPDLEGTVEQRRRLTQLVADLRALPERQRGALVMRELSGLSHAEIGTALGITAPQAKQAILEARTSLQEAEKGRAMRCADVRDVVSARDGRKLRARSVRAHLRGCDDCRSLRDAIATREADLKLLAPPLPLAASAAVLAKALGGGSAAGGAGAASGGGAAATAVGGSLAAKAAVGAVVLATAGAGVGVRQVTRNGGGNDRSAVERTAPARAKTERTAGTPATATIIPAEAKSTESTSARPVEAKRRRRRARPAAAAAAASAAAVAPPRGKAQGNGHGRGKPAGTPGKTRAATPVKTPKPARTPRPAKAAKPVKAPKPARTPRPAKTAKPVKTPKPVTTPPPRSSAAPVKTADPAKTPKTGQK